MLPTNSHRPSARALHVWCWSLPHGEDVCHDSMLDCAGAQLKHLTSLTVAANSICITLPAALRLRRLCLFACSKLCLHFESAGETAAHLQAFDIACRYLLHQEPIDALQVRLYTFIRNRCVRSPIVLKQNQERLHRHLVWLQAWDCLKVMSVFCLSVKAEWTMLNPSTAGCLSRSDQDTCAHMLCVHADRLIAIVWPCR